MFVGVNIQNKIEIFAMFTAQNIILLLFFIPVYQLVFYTIQLITFKKSSSRSRWYLGLFLLSLTVFLTINALFYLDYQKMASWSFYLFVPVFLLLIPLFYRYLSEITSQSKSGFAGNKMLLFLPATLIMVLNIIVYGNLPYLDKLMFVYSGFSTPGQFTDLHVFTALVFRIGFFLLVFFQIVFYGIKIVIILRSQNTGANNDVLHQPFVNTRWLSYISINLILFIIVNILFNLITTDQKTGLLISYNIAMIVTGGLIGYFGMKQELLLGQAAEVSSFNNEDSNRLKERIVKVSDEEKSIVMASLRNLMESKKIFLNSRLSIDDLAGQLKINKRIISIVVNDETGGNIYAFINDYRIRESKKLITDPDMNYLSIEGIAERVGFVSKSCFNQRFKRATGKTPSQYKKESKKKLAEV